MRFLIIVTFCFVMISCENKKTDVNKIKIGKTKEIKNKTKIKVLENQVFHSVLYENEYCYFLGKKGDFVDVTLNFNVKRLANEATIDNIFYSNDFNTYQNQLYRIKNYTTKNSSNYIISVFDEGEDKDAKINFSMINKKEGVWKFQLLPSWKEGESKRDYLSNLDLRDEYLFINKKNIDSILVLAKLVWYENDNSDKADTVSCEKPYYFKLKEKYKSWKNYNPIRFVSSKGKINIYERPDLTSKIIANLKYNDWIIINDTLKKEHSNSEDWLDIYDRENMVKGYILNRDLAEKPSYSFPVVKDERKGL